MGSQMKIEVLRQLMDEVSKCRKCDLWRSRRKPVLGDGSVEASIVFIGEAPGYWEDIKGKPFVGSAGKLLNEILKENSISRDEIYITNVMKCRPPENRDPRPEEIAACKNYLERQLDLIRPKIIVTLGRHSTEYIFSKAGIPFKSISEVQGRIYEVKFWETKTYVVPSYHPAAALYNVNLRDKINGAIRLVRRMRSELGV